MTKDDVQLRFCGQPIGGLDTDPIEIGDQYVGSAEFSYADWQVFATHLAGDGPTEIVIETPDGKLAGRIGLIRFLDRSVQVEVYK